MDKENQKVIELCNRIHEQSAIIEGEQLREILDKINQEVQSPEKLVISDCVKICDALHDIDSNKLTDICILNHPINDHLLKTLFNILNKWQRRDLLNEQETQIFNKTATLIKNIIYSKNIQHMEIEFFINMFNDPNPIKGCIDNIAKYGKYINDSNTNHLATLVQAVGVLQRKRPRLMDDKNSLKLLDSIVDCLSSQTYIQQLHFTFLSEVANNYFKDYRHFQLVGETTTNCGTSLLLNACPSYFIAYKGEHRQEISYKLTERMLDQYEQILDKFVPFLANCTDNVIYSLHHLMTILVSISNVDSCRVKFNEKPNLILSLIRISNSPSLCTVIQSTVDTDDNPCNLLINSTLTLLYNLTCETNILQSLKSIENTAKTFLNLIKIARYSRIRLQALQIVAVILNDDDIKNLDSTQLNPSDITLEFLKFLRKAIESSTQRYLGVHVYSLLCNLRALLQHDKMQDEFFKQNGIKLVLSCRMKFGDLYLPLVLEILATMTCHKEAGELLKNDANFMNDLETYMKSYDENVQKNAKAIKWKLVDSEKKDIPRDTVLYDIMISYAHAQNKFAHKLLQYLRHDGFRVWIDTMASDNVLSSTANAVNNSEIILICMSTEYNNSSSCRLECQYAFELKRKIIPIRVQQKFRPDGWLGIITADLLWVDFSRRYFNDNYKYLKNQLRQN